MNKTETDKQVRLVCRMRRLSRHTEATYSGWITRFGAHVKTCAHLPRGLATAGAGLPKA